jgi:predicted nucleic acid-binding protein
VNNPRVIVDTGPLVAFLAEREKHHDWCGAQFEDLPAPFLTCEAVLTEAYYLVSRLPDAANRFFELLSSGLIETDFSMLRERAALRSLMLKYKDLPMSLADACVVRLSELHSDAEVFTLDSDFSIYRAHGRRRIRLITPQS